MRKILWMLALSLLSAIAVPIAHADTIIASVTTTGTLPSFGTITLGTGTVSLSDFTIGGVDFGSLTIDTTATPFSDTFNYDIETNVLGPQLYEEILDMNDGTEAATTHCASGCILGLPAPNGTIDLGTPSGTFTLSEAPIATPEPTTAVLTLVGLGGLAMLIMGKRRRDANAPAAGHQT